MRNAVVVIANDVEKFYALINNLPTELKSCVIIAICEERIGTDISKFNKILEYSDVVEHYKVIGSSKIIELLKSTVVDTKFVDDYTMGTNILATWYILKVGKGIGKILLIDDDIILNKGVIELFNGGCKFAIDSLRKAKKNAKISDKQLNLIKEFYRVFELKYNLCAYFDNYINGGHKLISLDMCDLGLYERCLYRFYGSDIIYKEYWQQRSRYTSWCLDEIFEAFYFRKLGLINDELHNNRNLRMLVYKSEKITDGTLRNNINYKIVHICNNHEKEKVYERMKKLGVIK